jgi:serine phosphatase RsbU (regulator of sigma subunit)
VTDWSEDERLRQVERLDIVGTPPEERFDRITRLARELFGVPVAEINFIDAEHQFTKSPQAPGATVAIPREESFCNTAIRSPEMLVVDDATRDERFARHRVVTGPRHVRFYAGRPLTVAEGSRVGTLCLVDTEPRTLDESERRLLDEMGSWVERELQSAEDLERASRVQRGLLPRDEQIGAGYSVAALSRPARGVGGDFYAWRTDEEHFDVLLVDAMGKGTAGAIIAATVRATALAHADADPAALLRAVDTQLERDFHRTQTFATAFAARLHLPTGVLRYADAGHGLSGVLRSDGSTSRLAATGLPLGISLGSGWSTEEITLDAGEALVSVTDGALDVGDGTLESLSEVFAAAHSAGDASSRLRSLTARLDDARLTDDVAVAVVARDPGVLA